jgi:hypothetical protein
MRDGVRAKPVRNNRRPGEFCSRNMARLGEELETPRKSGSLRAGCRAKPFSEFFRLDQFILSATGLKIKQEFG